MIFNDTYLPEGYKKYNELLTAISSISELYSKSETPYIDPRFVENSFCLAFDAVNLSRRDTAFDASKIIDNLKIGIGLKTFCANINNNGISESKTEKIAEFNSDAFQLKNLSVLDATLKIAELRNARINSAILEYGIDKSIYHAVIRFHDKINPTNKYILLKEYDYDPIVVSDIVCTDKNFNPLSLEQQLENSSDRLFFTDGKNYYSFNFSKSTLYRKFDTTLKDGHVFKVEKLKDPFNLVSKLLLNLLNEQKNTEQDNELEHVILPLYSTRKNKLNEKIVPEHSGLNQWNAKGRKRKFGEMYIPIPSLIHEHCKDFFPPRGTPFTLITPDNTEIQVTLCQGDGAGKALMSTPNTALSKWFHPLLVKEKNENVVTYNDFKRIGKDSVKFEKLSDNKFKFSLAQIESWEIFKNKF